MILCLASHSSKYLPVSQGYTDLGKFVIKVKTLNLLLILDNY